MSMIFRCVSYLCALALCTSSCGNTSKDLTFPSLSNPSTSVASTTTTVANELVESAVSTDSATTYSVVSDFSNIFMLRAQCGRMPETCPVSQMTATGSELAAELTKTMRERVAGNLRTRAGAGKLRVRIESVEIIDTSHAVVHTCVFDSVVLFDSGQVDSAADDIVFDDSVISVRTKWNVQRENGTWKWRDARGYQRKVGGDLCGFSR
jgi:hypothetical protein